MANESADQNLPTRAPTYSSAWVDEHTISIAGKAVEEKSNEITAIPDVLDSIDLTEAVVSIDVMGTQTDIAQMIVESEANYVLALKRNHRHLSEDVKDAFTGRYTQFIYSTLDKERFRAKKEIGGGSSSERRSSTRSSIGQNMNFETQCSNPLTTSRLIRRRRESLLTLDFHVLN